MTIEKGDLFFWKHGNYQQGFFIITGSKKLDNNASICSTYRLIETGEDDWHFDTFILDQATKIE